MNINRRLRLRISYIILVRLLFVYVLHYEQLFEKRFFKAISERER